MRGKLAKGIAVGIGAGALCVLTPSAHAQNNGSAIADSLFKDGRKLMDVKRYDEACQKFAASEKAAPAIGTLLNLANCYEMNGQLTAAWTTFNQAASFAQQHPGPNTTKNVATAQDRADKLEPRLIKLTILARASGIDVKLDGTAVIIGSGLPIDPGKHTVEATAKGKKPFTTTVDITDKSKNPTVDIPPLDDDTTPAGAIAPTPHDPNQPTAKVTDPPTEVKSSWGTQKTLAVVLAGAGVVALGVGVYYGLLTNSRWNEAKQLCNEDNPPKCTQQGVDLADQAKAAGTIATIAFVGGGLFVAGGGVLFLTAPSAPKTTTTGSSKVKVGIGPGSFLVKGTF